MTTTPPSINILNFDEALRDQDKLNQWPHRWIELSDIEHCNMFCEEASAEEISNRLLPLPDIPITFTGSGNYHYITYLILKTISHPFSLVLFDNHTDTMDKPLLSCASWLAKAFDDIKNLEEAVVVGAHSDYDPGIPDKLHSKISLLPSGSTPEEIYGAVKGDNVYISIDKDVLSVEDALTNWDQGTLSLSGLLNNLSPLLQNKTILGLDVCGEIPYPAGNQGRYPKASRINQEANLNILRKLSEDKVFSHQTV